jgi:BioD-like phosphotransacetylase family protein
MKKILMASTREGAGKTSIIVGLAGAVNGKYGFIKPFGDRLVYRKKKNWDYDCFIIRNLWQLDTEIESEEITLGFNHAKLRYVYNRDNIKQKLLEMAEISGKDKDFLFIEGCKNLTYGTSIHLDSISMAKHLGARLVFIISGDDDTIMDDIAYIKKYIEIKDIDFGGVILNKIQDNENFSNIFLQSITDMGIQVLGILPYQQDLTYFSVNYLAKKIAAKVIAGENGLEKTVKNIFVGAMSTNRALRNPLFGKQNKLLITSGDRHDMILAAIDSETAGILLTNNIVPPSNIISRASEKGIPLLLVESDTFEIAKQTDKIEALLTEESSEKIYTLTQLIKENVKTDYFLK